MSQLSSVTDTPMESARVKSVNRRIFQALLSLASAALLVRVAGMLYQVVVTARFGIGPTMDAYFVASTIPLLLALLIADAMEISVIPVYTRIRAEGTQEQSSRFFSTLLNCLFLGAVLLTLLMLVFRYQLILISAPALGALRTGVAVDLTPFLFPAFLFMTVIGFLECILNAEGQFGWPAYAGILVPLSTAVLVLLVSRSLGIVTLGIGMLIGLTFQLGVFIVRLRWAGIKYRPVLSVRTPEIRSVLVTAWPVLLAAVVTQALPFVDQVVASFLSAGSISALNYATKLISVPVGVIFASVGRAALPYLSRQSASNDLSAFKETLRLYLWGCGLITILLTICIIIFAHPLVRLLFQHGAFSAGDTNRTAAALVGFTIGLTAMAIGFLLAKAFSALGKTKVLMGVTLFSVVANTLFDILFAHFWQGFGIALATSTVYVCTMCIMLLILRRAIGPLSLFAPPPELLTAIRTIGTGQWFNGKDGLVMLLRLPRMLTLQVLLIVGSIVGSLAVVASFILRSLTPLRVAFGAFAILAFLRYPYALLLAWVLVNPLIGSPLPFFNGNHFLTDLVVPTLLLMLFIPLKQVFQRLPVLVLLLVFLLWIFASIGISPIGHGTFLNLWASYVQYVTVAVLTIGLLATRQRLSRLIDAMLLLSTFVVLYGLYDLVTKQYLEYDRFTSVPRILSIFGSAPAVAMFLSVGIPLALYRVFTLSGRKRVAAVLVGLILLAGVWLSYTRAAYIAIPLGLIVMILCLPSRKMRITVLGGILALSLFAVLLASVGHVPIFSRFLSKDVLTLNGRTYLWQAILSHFDPTQILGRGLRGSDVLLANLQVRDQYGVIGTVAHSIFLETLYDHGIVGLVLLVAIFIALFISLVQGIRKATGEHRLLFATALAIFVSMLLQSIQSNDLLTDLTIGSYFWIAMALPFALCWTAQPTTVDGEPTHGVVIKAEEIPDTGSEATQQDKPALGRRLRVCLVSLAFPPLVGGAEIQAERHARQLRALGHEVMVVTMRHDRGWKRMEVLEGSPIVRVGGIYRRDGRLRIGRIGHIPADFMLFVMLWRLRHRYDVLHVFQALFPAAVATMVGHLTRKPVIVRIQVTGPDDVQRAKLAEGAMLLLDTLPATDAEHLRIPFMDWAPGEGDITYLPHAGIGGSAMVSVLRRSDAIFHVLSTRSRSYLVSHGFREDQIIHIPNGIDTERFLPAPEYQPDPQSTDRPIICVARLEYNKGIDVLLHAWGHLVREKAEWGAKLTPVLRLVGDGALRQQMKWMAVKLGIQDSVQFLGTRADIIELLQRSWAFVLPSRWEGMPNTLLEAMACGLPCVATRVSGSEDIISDGVNGLLVETEQPVALAEALHHLITDPELAQRLRLEARATILQRYQLPVTVGQSVALYRRLLARTNISLATAGGARL